MLLLLLTSLLIGVVPRYDVAVTLIVDVVDDIRYHLIVRVIDVTFGADLPVAIRYVICCYPLPTFPC